MEDLLQRLSVCVEKGKVNLASPYPPAMKGEPGASELCLQALEAGIPPERILNEGLVAGMARIGDKYSAGKAFIPEMLIAAKAMTAAITHLKPFFQSGEVKRKGTLVIGTVLGDLHDIGKNLVAMMVEGAGWEVVDLGVDVGIDKIRAAINDRPKAAIGLSALLTTTMVNMESMVKEIKSADPERKILVGGAPLSQDFCNKIGADFYSRDPKGAIEYLNKLA
jgi:5-methyltetrahydrofolate--homocysteine methyltransferase